MKLAVAGTGYVGLSLAVLLSQRHHVTAVDIVQEKINQINSRKSFVTDGEIEQFLSEKQLNLTATVDGESAYREADFIIIATPTDFDLEKNCFDTSSIDEVLKVVEKVNPAATVIIKSTVPVGFLDETVKKYKIPNLLFSPEFLREGRALYDNLHPSRIIVGVPADADETARQKAGKFAELLQEASLDRSPLPPIMIVQAKEAESIKLFANFFLALRVAFFNELDTYAEAHGLNAEQIIRGVSLDPRIGSHYNNPSFGYGGYCLPKDTMQMFANYEGVPNDIIKAVIDANETRKDFIAFQIMRKNPKVVGIYRLIMKSGSDNYRASAVQGVMQRLKEAAVKIIVYEPTCHDSHWHGYKVENDWEIFTETADIIVANRFSPELEICQAKVYTRDIFGEN